MVFFVLYSLYLYQTKLLKTFKTFITTTLPYANGSAHIGHALEFIQADFLARFSRRTDETYFNIGLDEHGKKIYNAANDAGVDVKDFLNEKKEVWVDFCEKFNISYDNFYRTSDETHYTNVQRVWNTLLEQGDIYKKQYKGKYCVGCESFKLDKEIENNKCLDHPNLDIEEVEEENYFFNISKYKAQVYDYVNNSLFVIPSKKKNELLNLIENAEDISISRINDNVKWGIPVPNDEEQTIYVWFEALTNYLLALGEDKWDDVKTFQLCGPDNIRFQGLFFQAILASLNKNFTDKLLVHGTILDDKGQKMSKTVGNVIDPIDQLEKYRLEAVRYYILSLPTVRNCNWVEEDLINIYNSHLVNDYGNLIARTLHLIDAKNVEIIEPEDKWKTYVDVGLNKLPYTLPDISSYVFNLNELIKSGNKYINDKEPWKSETYVQELSNLYYLLARSVDYYEPIIPNVIPTIKDALEAKVKTIIFKKL